MKARAPHLRAQVASDGAAITAGAAPCGHSCWCHSPHPCTRTAHPADTPHVAKTGEGLVQWAGPCPPLDGNNEPMTPEKAAEALTAWRREHTTTLLANVDLDQLAAALKGRI